MKGFKIFFSLSILITITLFSLNIAYGCFGLSKPNEIVHDYILPPTTTLVLFLVIYFSLKILKEKAKKNPVLKNNWQKLNFSLLALILLIGIWGLLGVLISAFCVDYQALPSLPTTPPETNIAPNIPSNITPTSTETNQKNIDSENMKKNTTREIQQQHVLAAKKYRDNASKMSTENLRTLLLETTSILLSEPGYYIHLSLEARAYLIEYELRVKGDEEIEKLGVRLLEIYGPCWGIPSGQCRE